MQKAQCQGKGSSQRLLPSLVKENSQLHRTQGVTASRLAISRHCPMIAARHGWWGCGNWRGIWRWAWHGAGERR